MWNKDFSPHHLKANRCILKSLSLALEFPVNIIVAARKNAFLFYLGYGDISPPTRTK
jgi:hypothetical protein